MRAEFYVKIGALKLIKRSIKFCGIGTKNVILRAQVQVGIDNERFKVNFHVILDAFLNDDVLIGSDVLGDVDMRIKSGKIISITKVVKEPDEAQFINKIDVVSDEIK